MQKQSFRGVYEHIPAHLKSLNTLENVNGCPPRGVNDAAQAVTAPAVSGPGVGAFRRDSMGIPMSVDDTVEMIDGTRVEVVGFSDPDRFIYRIKSADLQLRTYPCVAVVIRFV